MSLSIAVMYEKQVAFRKVICYHSIGVLFGVFLIKQAQKGYESTYKVKYKKIMKVHGYKSGEKHYVIKDRKTYYFRKSRYYAQGFIIVYGI